MSSLRSRFPALDRLVEGRMPIFLDGPGGSQVPKTVIDAVADYLGRSNANSGGPFTTSRETDALIGECHRAAADLLNAPSPDEIVFGANMTTLTLHLSRSVARTLRPGDEVLVTRLDHDANVSPWALAARDAGATLRKVDVRLADGTLDLDDFERQLSPHTRVVAVTAASNLIGSLTDVPRLCRRAHEVGALVYVDAVHAAPHVPLDVQSWGCDFLACSAYKFFGPHVGVLWGKAQHLKMLTPYKLRPSTDESPGRWMTGTQNHEGLAGVVAAVDYLADVGRGAPPAAEIPSTLSERRGLVRRAMTWVRSYERELTAHLLEELGRYPQFKVWGITDRTALAARTPTIALTSRDRSPQELCEALAAREIYSWAGNMYALELTERLGIETTGGALRLGFMHYNTHEEIPRIMAALLEA